MNKSFRIVATLAASTALVLAGCGGSEKGGSQGEAAAKDEDQGLVQINAQDRENLQQGGELRLSIGEFPEQWNGNHATGAKVDTNDILEFTMPANFDFDGKAVPTPNQNFLLSYEVVDGPPQVVKLKLNPKAKWNNGTPITWEDYQATWKAQNGSQSDYNPASTEGFEEIESVEKGADEFEVVITYKEPYPDWIGSWVSVNNREAMGTAKNFNEAMIDNPHPEWLAGPFTFKDDSIDRAQKTVTLYPNDAWWGDKPLLDKVIFRTMETGTTSQAFLNNEIDVIKGIVTADGYQKASSRADGEVRQAPGKQWRHFTFNSKSGFLADKGVRQAIVKGTNREAITQSDLAGMPVDPAKQQLGSHIYMTNQADYVDNTGDFKYDPEAAAKQLDELGWKLKDGAKYRTNDAGEELAIGYTMIANVPTSENEGKLFQADMEKIGVKVNIENIASDKFSDTLQERNFGVIAFAWQGTNFPLRGIDQIYGCDSSNNYSGVCNDKLTELQKQIATELDPAKRVELAQEADKVIWDEVMVLPLYSRVEMVAVPKNLANYGAFGFSSGRVENIGFMK